MQAEVPKQLCLAQDFGPRNSEGMPANTGLAGPGPNWLRYQKKKHVARRQTQRQPTAEIIPSMQRFASGSYFPGPDHVFCYLV